MLEVLGTIVVGFIVGLIARAVKPGDDKLGLIMTTLLGIAGAFLARYAGMAMGWYQNEPAGWIASVIGVVRAVGHLRTAQGEVCATSPNCPGKGMSALASLPSSMRTSARDKETSWWCSRCGAVTL